MPPERRWFVLRADIADVVRVSSTSPSVSLTLAAASGIVVFRNNTPNGRHRFPMRAFKSLRIVGWLTAALLVAIGVAEATFANGTRAHQTLFFVALSLFAVLIVAGITLLPRRPWLGAGLASLGAVLGGVSLFWTVVALLLAIAIVTLSVVCARRMSAQPV